MSLDKKLGIVVPLAAALIGAAVTLGVAALGSAGHMRDDSASTAKSAGRHDGTAKAKRPRLMVIDLAAIDDGSMHLTLVNAGDFVAVVKKIGVEVRESVGLRECSPTNGPRRPAAARFVRPSRSYGLTLAAYRRRRTQLAQIPRILPWSGSYDLRLPTDGAPGTQVMLTVSHELKPDTADKLKIKLSSPGDGQQLHRVRVVVYHDTSPKPVRAGEVLVAVPRVRIQGYLQASSSAACLRDNRAKLRRLLKTGAPAPAKLVNLLAEES